MTASDDLPACMDLGLADTYAVPSQHGAKPYLVACLFDGQWVCSCPSPHAALRLAGKYCRPIRTVIDLRAISTLEQRGGS